jgi:hypothetical protein
VEHLVPQNKSTEFVDEDGDRITRESTKYMPWLNEDDARDVLFISVHGYGSDDPYNDSGKFYPGPSRAPYLRPLNQTLVTDASATCGRVGQDPRAGRDDPAGQHTAGAGRGDAA